MGRYIYRLLEMCQSEALLQEAGEVIHFTPVLKDPINTFRDPCPSYFAGVTGIRQLNREINEVLGATRYRRRSRRDVVDSSHLGVQGAADATAQIEPW